MEAIILAGGAGTRLRSVVSNLPKPMAPVAGRPFLAYLFEYMSQYPVTRTVLAVSYMRDSIQEYIGQQFAGIPVGYSVEEKPLGTGGAILQAVRECTGEHVLVLNGDTFFNVDLDTLLVHHARHNADITIALKEMTDIDRYGTVEIREGKIAGFQEKQPCKQGYINGGIYALRRNLFAKLALPDRFSFETDILQCSDLSLTIAGLPCSDNFIDIGIPEDYEAAQALLPKWASQW